MIQSRTKIETRYYETDKMGFVHHQHYVQYFEFARVAMLSEFGLPYIELEREGFFLPVLGISIDYIRPNTFGDTLEIVTFMEKEPRVKLELRYEVYRDGELTTTGSSRHAFMNREGRAVRPPANFTEHIHELFAKS